MSVIRPCTTDTSGGLATDEGLADLATAGEPPTVMGRLLKIPPA
jgi:hypothetical protein